MIQFVRKHVVSDVRELGSSWFVISIVRESHEPAFQQHAISVLSELERQRFNGFQSTARARSYLLGRCAAKLALSEVSDSPSHQWSIETGVYGQPIVGHLKNPTPMLQVSISHATHVAVAVISPAGWPICVDLEEVSDNNVRLISEFLSQGRGKAPLELNQLELDRQQKLTAIWAMTEAASKHLGGGLAIDRRVFDIDRFILKEPCLLWSSFSNLPHIQAWTGVSSEHVLSLVMPKPGNLIDSSALFLSSMQFLSQVDSTPAMR